MVWGGVGGGQGRGRGVQMRERKRVCCFENRQGMLLCNGEVGRLYQCGILYNICDWRMDRTLWPSGLRRWLKAPVRKGVGSNPTGVIAKHFEAER